MEHLSRDELLALLRQARTVRERDWLMILVAFSHGLRASEVIAIKRDDVHDGFLTVQRLKGSMKTTQPLVTSREPLLSERDGLIDFVAQMHGNQKVFPISRVQFFRLVRRHARAAGIPNHKAHPHALKHSIAMQTIGKAGIENVRQYLGHKSMSSTGAYLRVTDSEAAAAVGGALRGRKL